MSRRRSLRSPIYFASENVRSFSNFTGIQALRFAAALMVVVSHTMTMLVDHGLTDALPRWIGGHAGVDIFFVISGFVMSLSFASLSQRSGGWWVFLSRRLIRIVPLYWLATTLKLVVAQLLPGALANGKPTIALVAASYFFLPGLAPLDGAVALMPVGWTLNYEMFFYSICALALLVDVSPFWSATFLLSVLVLRGWLHPSASVPEASYQNPIMLEFIFGMVIARIAAAGVKWPTYVCAAVVFSGFFAMFLVGADPTYWRPLIWGVPAALIVCGVVIAEGRLHGRIPQILLRCGDASYSLYLVHTFVVPVALIAVARHRGTNPWLVVIATAVASVSVSLVVYQWLERPITNRLKRAFSTSSSLGGAVGA